MNHLSLISPHLDNIYHKQTKILQWPKTFHFAKQGLLYHRLTIAANLRGLRVADNLVA